MHNEVTSLMHAQGFLVVEVTPPKNGGKLSRNFTGSGY